MLESKVCQYEIGYTEILLVRSGLGLINSSFKVVQTMGAGHARDKGQGMRISVNLYCDYSNNQGKSVETKKYIKSH
jgi:hypothetical protein